MRDTSENIPFELHLTTKDLLNEAVVEFETICEAYNGKAIIIELSRGKVAKQPMFSKTIYKSKTKDALETAKKYVLSFAEKNFQINRLKVEIPYQFSSKILHSNKNNSQTYFEWHGKISPDEISNLTKVCEKHAVHLSRNSLKKELGNKFLTLREYGKKEVFEERLNLLKIDLRKNGGTIYKQELEYCVYDSNITLDEGWLTE